MPVTKGIFVVKNPEEWLKHPPLNEIYGYGLEFALVNNNGEVVHQPVYCKDFLHSIIVASMLGTKISSLYGIKYDPKTDPSVDQTNLRYLIRNPKFPNFAEQVEAMCDFMNQIESVMRVSKSIASPVYELDGSWLIQASPRWLRHPAMVSMNTLLLRVGLTHVKGDKWEDTVSKRLEDGKVQGYMQLRNSFEKVVKPIIMCSGECFSVSRNANWIIPKDLDHFHNFSGVCSIATRKDYELPFRGEEQLERRGIAVVRNDDGCSIFVDKAKFEESRKQARGK